MTETLIGYARCSTDRQDLDAQHQALLELGVAEGSHLHQSRPQRELCPMHATGEYSISDLAELCSVSRPTVYRTLNRRLSP